VKFKPGDLVRHGNGQFADDWGVGLVMKVGPKEDNWVEIYWFKEKFRRMHPTERLTKVEAQSEH
jgi:hypothetical protein